MGSELIGPCLDGGSSRNGHKTVTFLEVQLSQAFERDRVLVLSREGEVVEQPASEVNFRCEKMFY
jgi:hypothetical protein